MADLHCYNKEWPGSAQEACMCLWRRCLCSSPVFLSQQHKCPEDSPGSCLPLACFLSCLLSTTSSGSVHCLFLCGSKSDSERSRAWATALMFLACMWNSFISGAKHKGQFQQPQPSTSQLWYCIWMHRAKLKIDKACDLLNEHTV